MKQEISQLLQTENDDPTKELTARQQTVVRLHTSAGNYNEVDCTGNTEV